MSSGLTEGANLTLEDGTGVTGANTYVTIAEADAYATDRQYDAFFTWLNGTNESNKVSALIAAARYIDSRFFYRGVIAVPADPGPIQGLAWPRIEEDLVTGVFDVNYTDTLATVPQQIKDAAVEYAVRTIDSATFQSGTLMPDLAAGDDQGRTVSRMREKVGPLEEETYYDTTKTQSALRGYATPDQIIRNSGLARLSSSQAIRN